MKNKAKFLLFLCATFIVAQNAFADTGTTSEQKSEALLFAKAVTQEKISNQETTKTEANIENNKSRLLSGIEFLSGYQWGRLKRERKNLEDTPFLVDFNFNLKPLLNKIHITPPTIVEFQLEPFISYIYKPYANVETGLAFWFKLGLVPESWKLQVYGKFGAGLDYMTLHARGQGTQFNFIDQLAAGMSYSFRKDTALIVEGRLRHLSNAGIKQPNNGINSYSILCGISKKY